MQWFHNLMLTVSGRAPSARDAVTKLVVAFVGMYLGYLLAQQVSGLAMVRTLNQFGAEAITVAALAIFSHFLFDKFFGKYSWVQWVQKLAVKLFLVLGPPALIGAVSYLTISMSGSLLFETMLTGMDVVTGKLLGYMAGSPAHPGFGWLMAASAATAAILICAHLKMWVYKHNLKYPYIKGFKGLVLEVELRKVPLALILLGLFGLSALIQTFEHLALNNELLSFILSAPYTTFSIKALCLGLSVLFIVRAVWKQSGYISLPSIQRFSLPRVYLGMKDFPLAPYAQFSPAIFKKLAVAWIVSIGAACVYLFNLTGYLPALTSVMPWTHIAIKAVIIAGPIYLFLKYFSFRNENAPTSEFAWFGHLAKPQWVSGSERYKTWFYFVLIAAGLLIVVQLNSTIQDAYAAMTNVAVAKDQAGTYAAQWTMLKVFMFAMLFMPFNYWLRRKAFFHWRKGLTSYVLGKYLAIDRKYLAVAGREDVDNPDERIHEDIQEFTSRSYNLVLSAADAFLTLGFFALKLYGISLALSVAAIVYALVGTVIMFLFTKKMVAFAVAEKRLEANFRYYLIFIRIQAEAIAFFRGHGTEKAEVERRFARILENFNKLNAWQRNLEHFSKGYSYLDSFVVWAIMLPIYFAGTIQWGDIQGAQMAFGMVLGALSLFVNEFVTWARFRAVNKRLGHFHEVLSEPEIDPNASHVETIEVPGSRSIKVSDVTIVTPRHNNKLVQGLSVEISPTNSLIVVGPSGSGKSSLLRIVGGLWKNGAGSVERPSLDEFMFLPQKPLLNVGTLRDQILYPNLSLASKVSDAELEEHLATVGLPHLTKRFPQGLDTMQEYISWGDVLSPGEQQRISFARVLVSKPKIVILDEATAALDVKNEKRLYERLKELGVTFMSVGHRPSLVHYHTQVLEFLGDGSFGWRLMTPAEYDQKQRDEAAKD